MLVQKVDFIWDIDLCLPPLPFSSSAPFLPPQSTPPCSFSSPHSPPPPPQRPLPYPPPPPYSLSPPHSPPSSPPPLPPQSPLPYPPPPPHIPPYSPPPPPALQSSSVKCRVFRASGAMHVQQQIVQRQKQFKLFKIPSKWRFFFDDLLKNIFIVNLLPLRVFQQKLNFKYLKIC